MFRINHQREELGWNPTLADFKNSASTTSEMKSVTDSWKKALNKKMSAFLVPGKTS